MQTHKVRPVMKFGQIIWNENDDGKDLSSIGGGMTVRNAAEFLLRGANSVQVSQPSHTAPCWKAYCAHEHVSCSISMYGIHASSVCQYHTGKKGMSNCSEE